MLARGRQFSPFVAKAMPPRLRQRKLPARRHHPKCESETNAAFIAGSILCITSGLLGQSGSPNLPKGTAVKDNGPRSYRFTIDYNTANSKGDIVRRQRFMGEYTRGLPNGEVAWKNVVEADADGAAAGHRAWNADN